MDEALNEGPKHTHGNAQREAGSRAGLWDSGLMAWRQWPPFNDFRIDRRIDRARPEFRL
jgi:hypothetical protein